MLVENAAYQRTGGSSTPSPSTSTLLSSGLAWPVFHDPEQGMENPAEQKAQKLARPALYRGVAARDLKPGAEERRKLEALLARPPASALSVEERSLLWVFRYSLLSESRALTKVLRAADWSDVTEAREALSLMLQWGDVDRAVALELLSSDFPQAEIRSFGVSRLAGADDQELALVLQQLVQALRYEPHRPLPEDELGGTSLSTPPTKDALPSSAATGKLTRGLQSKFNSSMLFCPRSKLNQYRCSYVHFHFLITGGSPSPLTLEELLLTRACGNIEIATYLHWSLRALWEDPWHGGLFIAVHGRLLERLGSQAPAYLTELRGQDEGISILGKIAAELKSMRAFAGQADRRGDRLRQLLSDGGEYSELGALRCSLPLDPSMSLNGTNPDECSVFRSAMAPLRISFRVKPCPLAPGPPGPVPKNYVAIFKQVRLTSS